MQLDIRTPIGLMFGLLGLILAIYGAVTASDDAMYQHSLGININLWCGFIFLVFAGVMLLLAWRSGKREPSAPPSQRSTAIEKGAPAR
jgi:threonine/homoserine/homoserine lactone efflux protein